MLVVDGLEGVVDSGVAGVIVCVGAETALSPSGIKIRLTAVVKNEVISQTQTGTKTTFTDRILYFWGKPCSCGMKHL